MEDSQPIIRSSVILNGAKYRPAHNARPRPASIHFDRSELDTILALYGRRVAEGDWRDYAIDFLKETAVFSVFRRASEIPLYRIEKRPKLANRQGAYAVISASGLILKRGRDLRQVLRVLEKKKLRLVD